MQAGGPGAARVAAEQAAEDGAAGDDRAAADRDGERLVRRAERPVRHGDDAAPGEHAGEGDGAGARGEDQVAGSAAEVHAAVTGPVRLRGRIEPAEDGRRPGERPGPRPHRRRGRGRRGDGAGARATGYGSEEAEHADETEETDRDEAVHARNDRRNGAPPTSRDGASVDGARPCGERLAPGSTGAVH